MPSATPNHTQGAGGKWRVGIDRRLFLEQAVLGRIPAVLHPFPDIPVNIG